MIRENQSQVNLDYPNKERGAGKFFATELERVFKDNVKNFRTQSEVHKINNFGIIELRDSEDKPKETKKMVKTKEMKEEPVVRDKFISSKSLIYMIFNFSVKL